MRGCATRCTLVCCVCRGAGSTTPFALATAVYATVYILVGIRFEEDKLLRLYGDAYSAYRKHVPMLLPWPDGHPRRQGNHLL